MLEAVMVVAVLKACVSFLLVPLGFGRCFTYRYNVLRRTDIVSQYVIGVFSLFALFTVACIPITVLGMQFHLLQIVNGVLYALSIAFLLLDGIFLHGLQDYRTWFGRVVVFCKTHWYVVIPAAFILFQVCRTVCLQTCVYSDDKTYISLINDMIRSDRILEMAENSGEYIRGLRLTQPKWLFCSWMQFLAVLSTLTGAHPLLFIKSIFPVFMIGFHYIIMWKLTYYLSTDQKKRICIILLYILLMEFGSPSRNTDFSYYLFTWSGYGKTAYQFAVIPMLFLFFFMTGKDITRWRDGLLLLIISITGMGISSMGLILLTIELSMLILLSSIRKHTIRETWLCLPAFLPVICGLLLNYIYF